MIYDGLYFKRLREAHDNDYVAAMVAAVRDRSEDAVEVLASADFYYGRRGMAALEAALELGLDPTAVADAINAQVAVERDEAAAELRGLRSLKGRL